MVVFATPVMRDVARMEEPSHKAWTTCIRRSTLRRFMPLLCLSGKALSRELEICYPVRETSCLLAES
jgi:hypothetical protein